MLEEVEEEEEGGGGQNKYVYPDMEAPCCHVRRGGERLQRGASTGMAVIMYTFTGG